MPVNEVEVSLRPYSKTYYGRYFPLECIKDGLKPKLYLYPYEKNGSEMSYDIILSSAIHEMVHHIQYSDPNFNRSRGVMHDPKFWELYNHYIKRAKRLKMIKLDGRKI